jgi:hypothetical protein
VPGTDRIDGVRDAVRGATGRCKFVRVAGIGAEALRSRWPGLDV